MIKIEQKEFENLGFHRGEDFNGEEATDFCKVFKLPSDPSSCTEYWADGLRLYYWQRRNVIFITHYHHGEMIAYFKPENAEQIVTQLKMNKYKVPRDYES